MSNIIKISAPKMTEATKKHNNKLLMTCTAYVVAKTNNSFRIPKVRACPNCKFLVELEGSREACKHVNTCPGCKGRFCMSCLSIPSEPGYDGWVKCCGGAWEKCPKGVAGRQQFV
eukprot:TRINITY_DN558_c0_g2_i4.p1 TRINITY_DN558_c0_g2~~TRINITY_DN558_c0_g2_i4.p1  ORF type:complete len:115 (-),score=1.12 TRINITY_DN558_c0_g2_i4:98-442(-)